MKKTAAVSEKGTVATKKAKQKDPYLTKRILISAAKRGFKEAAEEAMQLMGYTVIAQNGWVVKKYANGTIEKISRIEPVNSRNAISLD